MRIRVPRGTTKDQIFIVLVLGLGTGIYSWNNLLAEYAKEREKKLNEVIKQIAPKHWLDYNLYIDHNQIFRDYVISLTKSNNPPKKFNRLGFLIGGGLCLIGFAFYMRPWFRRRKAAQAEEFANFLYDQRKKKTLQQSED